MENQTFITLYENEHEHDFYRHFGIKKLKTIIEREKKFLENYKNHILYKNLLTDNCIIEIWETPDGYNKKSCLYKSTIKEFLEKYAIKERKTMKNHEEQAKTFAEMEF